MSDGLSGAADELAGTTEEEPPAGVEVLPLVAAPAAATPLSASVAAATAEREKGRASAKFKGATIGQATPVKRALPPMQTCPGGVCPACWNERHGRQAGGAHDRGRNGLRCLSPSQDKRRRTVAEASLEDVFPATEGADEDVDADRVGRAAENGDELPAAELAGDGDWREISWTA